MKLLFASPHLSKREKDLGNSAIPKGILIMKSSEFLRVKDGGSGATYRDGKFSGYLYVEGVPCVTTELTVEKILPELSFSSTEEAMKVKQQILDLDIISRIDSQFPTMDDKSTSGSKKALGDLKIFPISDEIKKDLEEVAKEAKKEAAIDEEHRAQLEKVEELPVLTTEPIKPKLKLKTVAKSFQDLPAATKKAGMTFKRIKTKFKKKEQPKAGPDVRKLTWPGAMIVGTTAYYSEGYCLMFVFTSHNSNEEEVVIYCSPKGYDGIETLPLITAKEKQGDYLLAALQKHPKFQNTVKDFRIARINELDSSTFSAKAWLIRDPKMYVNGIASGSAGLIDEV